MSKILVVVLIMFLSTISVYLFMTEIKLEKIITGNYTEIDLLHNQVIRLQEKLNQYELESTEMEIPSEIEIKKMIEEYFSYNHPDSTNNYSQVFLKDIISFNKSLRFFPNKFPITGNYSISQHFTEKHQGIDFAASEGEAVAASAAGVIILSDNHKYFGNVLQIDHLNGFVTVYAHLEKKLVEINRFVEKGETIALVGNTGNSTSPHLHFEIIYEKSHLNPVDFLRKTQ